MVTPGVPICPPSEAAPVVTPTEEEVDALLKKFGSCLRPEPLPRDQRRCCFCNQQGDGQTDGPARLLNLDLDLWVSLRHSLHLVSQLLPLPPPNAGS